MWRQESERHVLASKGIKTKRNKINLTNQENPLIYFETTKNSFLIPINLLVKDHEPSEEKKNKTRKYMNLLKSGANKSKREPILVRKISNSNKYLVLDGNTTTTVAPEYGLTKLVAMEE
jgi:hypothetical protein